MMLLIVPPAGHNGDRWGLGGANLAKELVFVPQVIQSVDGVPSVPVNKGEVCASDKGIVFMSVSPRERGAAQAPVNLKKGGCGLCGSDQVKEA